MTLDDILKDSASYLDLDTALPTSTELGTRMRFANMAVREWANIYKWRQLKTEAVATLGTADSIEIPNFKYLNSPPVEKVSTYSYYEYPEIQPEERYAKNSDDRYCYLMGNDSIGYFMYTNGLATNSTLSIPYTRGPSLMATLTDICEVPDATFVTSRVISYVLQSRNDERFPIVVGEGNRLLSNMIEQEVVVRPGGTNNVPKKGTSAYSLGG